MPKNYVNELKNYGTVNFNEHSKHIVPKALTPSRGKHRSVFIGRQEELKEIEKRLQESDSLLLINGIGGIGKSYLASYYFSIKANNFNHYGYVEVGENIKESFYVAFKKSLKLKEEDEFDDIIVELRNLEGNKLLVIDDVKNANKQREEINLINTLIEDGYKIIFTSRTIIEDVKNYYIGTLKKEDAVKLFLEHSKLEYSNEIDKILEYIGYHTFLIKLIAKTVVKKEGYSLQDILKKFKSGELCKINYKDLDGNEETINYNLNQLFNLQKLNETYILLLKKLSILPPIVIETKLLLDILKLDRVGKLNFLVNSGWLIEEEQGYKLHQIIKEYMLANHTPAFKEVKEQIDYFMQLIDNSADAQTAVDNRDKLIYFEAIVDFINRIKEENAKVATLFDRLGNIYYHLGDYEKAQPLYEKALDIREKVLGEKHPDTATSYNNLAGLYESLGDYEKALPLYKKALKINKEVLGESHPSTATSYNNLAGLYRFLGDYEKALPLYEKALKIREEVLGESHPSTATSYNNLSVFYFKTGELKKAKEYVQKAIDIREKVLPANHPDLVDSKEGLEMIELMLMMKKAGIDMEDLKKGN